jgi:internalin A
MLRIIEQATRQRWKRLDIYSGRFSELPVEIGQLTNLQELVLSGGLLTELPEIIGQLTSLQDLVLNGNRLTELPKTIGQLTNLQMLYLSANYLTELPKPIGQLTNLQELYLANNLLTELPETMGASEKLRNLDLMNNPLNPALLSAYESGREELWAYLRSLEDPALREELYEAKLIFVGEGGVGKTTLLRVMTGQPPREKEPTTHGVNIDIHSLHLLHPEKEGVEIRLNAWDFGGQEIYRVTHQFFFPRRSIFLLVWEPRRGGAAVSGGGLAAADPPTRRWQRTSHHRLNPLSYWPAYCSD